VRDLEKLVRISESANNISKLRGSIKLFTPIADFE
jgi:hypothetical protein